MQLRIMEVRAIARVAIVVTALIFCGSGYQCSAQVNAPGKIAPINAQVNNKHRFFNSYKQVAWTIDDGLPQSSINSIIQARDGYLWMATFDGLVRFDGARFRVFYSANTEGLPSSRIYSVYEDPSGVLWIGTENNGIARYHQGKFTSYSTREGLPSNEVNAVVADKDGGLWIIAGSQLAHLHNEKLTRYTTAQGLPSNFVNTIHADNEGNVWIGTNKGLARYINGSITIFDMDDGLSGNNIRALCSDLQGDLWIATEAGLTRFSKGSFTNFSHQNGLPEGAISGLYADRAGNIWISTPAAVTGYRDGIFTNFAIDGCQPLMLRDQAGNLWIATLEGIVCVSGGVVEHYTKKDGLPSNTILSMLEDREGNIWIGTNGGLAMFKKAAVRTITKEQGLSDNYILAITGGRDGSIWVGTNSDKGLNRIKDGKVTVYGTKEGLPPTTLWALCEDRAGRLWVGAVGTGLVQLSDEKINTFTSKDGLSHHYIIAIFEDRQGRLWIGTRGGGVNLLQNGRFITYRKQDGLSNDIVRTIHEDRQGNIWLATDEGLTRIKDTQFQTFTVKDGLSDNFIRAIYEDREGTLWFGTYGNGLNRFKDGRFTAYTIKDGLYDHTVSQIFEDDKGNFWLSGNKGICRVRRAELEAFAQGLVKKITYTAYGTAEGMKSRETNGGFQPAGYHAGDGRMWFPTTNGIAIIDPANLPVNQQPPLVALEQVVIDKVVVPPYQPYQAPHGLGELEFYYTGLSFTDPQKVRFKYLLEGFDKAWIDAGNRNVAYYTNIPPGSYTFKVMACNNDGIWSAHAYLFHFRLSPRFYQTYYFYSFCALLMLMMAGGVYAFRVRQLKARAVALRRLVEERTQHLLEANRELKVAHKFIELISPQTVIDNKYRIESILGRGGMGHVFLATHIELDKKFALKLMNARDNDSNHAQTLARFRREAASLAKISHPNVVTVTDFGIMDNRLPYIVMEYLEGLTLRKLLANNGRLSEKQALDIARQICAGLHEAHLHGIVHRDLKPENIMVQFYNTEEMVVRMVDFGIAKILDNNNSENLTSDEEFIGTPKYMSPEQLTGTQIDARSDIFGICLIIYEMLAGVVPAALLGEYQPLSELRADIAPPLDDILKQGMSLSPSHRYQSALELKRALERYANQESSYNPLS